MAEYIERETIKATMIHYGFKSQDMTVTEFVEDELPAADVAQVRHGRWEPGNPICPVCGGDKFKDLDADIWCDWMPDFCPNCGAKMDGGAE